METSNNLIRARRPRCHVLTLTVAPWSTRQDRIGNCDPVPSVELDQVLEDQSAPAISTRLDQQSTFRKPTQLDRCETEIFRKPTDFRCCFVIVAGQEHGSPATLYGWILG